jgi:branched-chain amino acid transport system ATP-binding protein
MLEVRSISCRYGSIMALRNATLTIAKGEFVALIGANGAGKTTLLRAISGLTPPHAGEILWEGTRIDRASAGEIVQRGIAHCPEERKIWPQLSVSEHLRLGAYGRRDAGNIRADIERIYETFPPLAERRRQLCGTLSGGEQQMVAIGRALMCRPRLLMLDEPSLGLAPLIVDQVVETVSAIHRQGTAILMVEQSAVLALRRAQRAYVLENGLIVKSGPGQDLLQDPDVKRAYLGGGLAGQRRMKRA